MTGQSMAPTLVAGDWFLTRPLAGLPRRGELVVMKFQDGDSLFHVLRRAVGLPGDTVAMRDGFCGRTGAPRAGPRASSSLPPTGPSTGRTQGRSAIGGP